jgi:hypothetical protein
MSSEQADFAAELAQRDAGARLYVTSLAVQAHVHRGYAHHIEHGYRRRPPPQPWAALDARRGAANRMGSPRSC